LPDRDEAFTVGPVRRSADRIDLRWAHALPNFAERRAATMFH
jgi:hypothetical protein